MSEQWLPIESAPKDGTRILGVLDYLPHWPVPLWWASYANEWRCPLSETQDERDRWKPIAWMPCPDVEPARLRQPA